MNACTCAGHCAWAPMLTAHLLTSSILLSASRGSRALSAPLRFSTPPPWLDTGHVHNDVAEEIRRRDGRRALEPAQAVRYGSERKAPCKALGTQVRRIVSFLIVFFDLVLQRRALHLLRGQ